LLRLPGLMQPTTGQLVGKPRLSYWQATTDSPRYGMAVQAGSALQEAASRCLPQASPGGAGHQSPGPIPHGSAPCAAQAFAVRESTRKAASTPRQMAVAGRVIAVSVAPGGPSLMPVRSPTKPRSAGIPWRPTPASCDRGRRPFAASRLTDTCQGGGPCLPPLSHHILVSAPACVHSKLAEAA